MSTEEKPNWNRIKQVYVCDGVQMDPETFKESWSVHDSEPAPDLGKHGWSGVCFNNDENRYAGFIRWEEDEQGKYV